MNEITIDRKLKGRDSGYSIKIMIISKSFLMSSLLEEQREKERDVTPLLFD